MKGTAIITGASSGIGAAIALALAEKGYPIAVGCHSPGSVERGGGKVAEECAALSGRAECFVADVADFDACAGMIEAVKAWGGEIGLLVNCAGVTRDGPIARMSEESFDQVMDTNLKGAFNTIRHLTPILMKQRFGKIINISSVVGLNGNRGQANYAASKAGVIGLTKAVAKELAPRGITCNAIAPGFIETAMTEEMPQQAREMILKATLLGRGGRPEEVAHTAVFLAENDFITGQVIVVDGGLVM